MTTIVGIIIVLGVAALVGWSLAKATGKNPFARFVDRIKGRK